MNRSRGIFILSTEEIMEVYEWILALEQYDKDIKDCHSCMDLKKRLKYGLRRKDRQWVEKQVKKHPYNKSIK